MHGGGGDASVWQDSVVVAVLPVAGSGGAVTNTVWNGLGATGGRMARRLAADGHDLAVWNRTPSRAEEFNVTWKAGTLRPSEPPLSLRTAV